MRVPMHWLHEYCRPRLGATELAARLDMTGTKVERVLHHGVRVPEAFVVGRVLAAEAHPDAERLRVCRVDVGAADPAQIVCGAPNVAAGQTVAVARPGAVMPDGVTLDAVTLRGVVSEGMILAEDELAIGTDHSGIVVLGADGAAPGTPLADVLVIADDVLELEVTPNRPDCLGVYGVAREVHAATGAALDPPPWREDPGSAGDLTGAEVSVEAPECCPRFTVRVFEEVSIGPSPAWLKARLAAAGQRPISNVVDVTNYVMMLTGQPLHAFDFDRVAGGRLVVRRALEGEQVQTLDGENRTLDADVVIICDDEGPTSIAGVMGGARSEVSERTTRVLMEAATWDGPNIQRTSTRLGLRSEASGRFEKQLAPEQAMEAQAVASALMIEVCGARAVAGTIDVGGPGPAAREIRLREARVGKLLGQPVPREHAREILESLGFGAREADDGLEVSVPAFRRNDVTREVDVIEEVARIAGMEKLPATLPAGAGGGRLTAVQRARRRAEDALADHGLLETVGWSFQSPTVTARLRLEAHDPRRAPVALVNPMSDEQSVMRTLLLGSLLDAARYNAARDPGDLRLFETGAVYRSREGGDGLPDERRHVGVLLSGRSRPSWWQEPEAPAVDYFAVKGVLAALLDTLRVPWGVQAGSQPFLHPGRCAEVLLADHPAGWIGELHPLVAQDWELAGAAVCELDLDLLTELATTGLPVYRDLTSFPVVRQDLAVVLTDDVPAERVMEVVRSAGGDLLTSAEAFDVYRGEQVGAGRVSLALALEFRAADRTLTDEEVGGLREAITAALRDQLGGELRG
ncbi:MAG: phenylalanine--tRNA ligase subunit beta [Actinomycetota bacterium]|nr:phenylalanine--tRNA ligase subunit beta [Actinomycetota bacterium]